MTSAPVSSAEPPVIPDATISDATAELRRLDLAAWLTIGLCAASLGFYLLTLVLSYPRGEPNAPSVLSLVGFIAPFAIAPAVGLAGALAMLRRNRYRLAIGGACCLLIPLAGPCFGLTIPLGVWTLLLLRGKTIRAAFADVVASPTEAQEYENADTALATAARLKNEGDWDGAAALYQSIALQWPEHASYIDNCLREIRTKRDMAG